MKKLSLLLLLSLLFIKGYSQNIAVQSARENIVYYRIDNPMYIAVENTSSDSLIITTDNGTIRRSGRGYIWRLNEVGKGMIWVRKLENTDTILVGGHEFRVENIPDPIACIGLVKGGKIDKNKIITYGALIPRFEDFDICATIRTISFTMIVMRNDEIIYSEEFKGNRLSDKAKDFIKTLKESDVILFVKIKAKGPDNILRSLQPVELIIEE